VAAAAKICSNCGATIPPDFKFCGKCGTPLEEATEEASAEQEKEKVEEKKNVGKLIFIRPDGSEGGEYPLSEGVNSIGRNYGELFEADGYLSPEHGTIKVEGDKLILQDEGSLNGVFFRITGEEELQPGDIFRVGQELLRFDAIAPPTPLEDGTEIMGSPNEGYWGRITVIVGYGVDGNAYPLNGDRVQVGRERGEILFPEDGYVSGAHLELTQREGQFHLRDLNSSNGTFLKIRGEKVTPASTYVLMGQQLFRVELSA